MSAVTDAMIMRVGGVVPVRYGLQVMRTGVDEGIIGRDHPVAVLRAEIGRATASHGGLVLVTGEAGIGKTALVTQAAQEARRGGVLVVGGSCWDSDSAPGYWPWVEVMRMLRRGDAGEWAAAREAGGIGLAVLLGERRGEDDEQRVDPFALHDAVTGALVAVSRQRPVMVVLDDLHGADPASLRLLTFAAQHTWFERVLLVGTYRDVEVEATDHPLRPLMTPLVAKATTLTLTGLGRDDVGNLIARTAGRRPDAAIVDEIHRRTGGNPFFVEQTARLWRADGETAAVAPGVRDAVRQRLSRLPPAVDAVLTAAAVLGREFHRQVLAAAAAQPAARVDRLLDQAATARLVGALGGGRFRFARDDSDVAYMGFHVRWTLSMLRGRWDDVEAQLAGAAVREHPFLELARCLTAVERGDAGPALRHIAAPPAYPRYMTPLWLRLLARTAAVTGDAVLADRARTALAPHRGQWLVSLFGCDVSGPVDLWIAVADAATGRWDEAVEGFTAARDGAERMGARPWSLIARAGLADALAGRGDTAAAAALRSDVEREAAEIGMPQLASSHRVDLADAAAAKRAEGASGQPDLQDRGRGEFRREGDVWRLAYEGTVVHLPDAKGLRDLHTLLQRPGLDLTAVELLDPAAGPELVAARRMGGDPVLDDEAKASYRRRLDQLDNAIDRATEHGDSRAADAYANERAALLDQLRAAAGLAGRTRRLGDEAERARKR